MHPKEMKEKSRVGIAESENHEAQILENNWTGTHFSASLAYRSVASEIFPPNWPCCVDHHAP